MNEDIKKPEEIAKEIVDNYKFYEESGSYDIEKHFANAIQQERERAEKLAQQVVEALLKLNTMEAKLKEAEADLEGREKLIDEVLNPRIKEAEAKLKNSKNTEENLVRLLGDHCHHWIAIADAVGGVALGGVDCDPKEALSNAAIVVEKVQEMRDALRAIMEHDGPGLDMSPGGKCYEIAKRAMDRKD